MTRRIFTGILSFFFALRNVRFFFLSHPATPLRIGLISALDSIAHLHGINLSSSLRDQAALFTDFASLMNRYYDGKSFNLEQYKQLRRNCRLHKRLIQLLPQYRKTLKLLSKKTDITNSKYVLLTRERETKAIFKTLCQLLSLPVRLAPGNAEATPLEKDIQSLLRLGYIIQMFDDVLDSEYDTKRRIPSYMTAFMFRKGLSKSQSVCLCLKRSGDHLAHIARTPSDAQIPVYLVGKCTHLLSMAVSYKYRLA